MDTFSSSLSYWMSVDGRFPSASFRAGILLQRNSLSRAYLTFSNTSSLSALFAIDSTFSRTTIIGDTVLIIFEGKSPNCLTFQCGTILEAQTLRTQICYCAHISKHTGVVFEAENLVFLATYGCLVDNLPAPAPLLPLLPIISDPRSAETWRRRCESLNVPYLTRAERLKVNFLTWNVERRTPSSDLVQGLLFLFEEDADLVVVTLQEIDFSVWALVVGTSPHVQPWSQLFEEMGGPKGYSTVAEASLGGVLLKVMKRESLALPLTAEIIDSVRLGANGLACNKSAVIAFLRVAGAQIGLIAAHLMAYVENERARTEQVEQLIRAFGDRRLDFLVLFGDLNYRVERDFTAAVNAVRDGDLQGLLADDQLSRLLAAPAPAFARFSEAPISFAPTFCFDPGTDEYDSSPKHRVPAWTDRVLVRTEGMREAVGPSDDVVCETDGLAALCAGEKPKEIGDASVSWPTVPAFSRYAAEPIRLSDHRPVAASIDFRVPVVLEERKKELIAELARRSDEFENGVVPAIEANLRRFLIAPKVEVVLMNRSVSVAKWTVDDVIDGLEVDPTHGELVPEQTRPIEFRFSEGASDCMVAVLVENGSPLLLEFVLHS